MNQKTWPNSADTSHYTALSFYHKTRIDKPQNNRPHKRVSSTRRWVWVPKISPEAESRPSDPKRDFSMLPNDIIVRIAGGFNHPTLEAASLVCRAWCDALRPLSQAMRFLAWGKKYKHGRGGVEVDHERALDYFLRGVARGSTLAMVDAGLLYWDMGKKEEGMKFYRRAAELGHPAGQCNLGLSYLQIESPDLKEATKWLYKAANSGYVRAQYQLALCLQHGRGLKRDLCEAAKWCIKAAEGGYVRAMYNTSLCYQCGDGVAQSYQQSKSWMKRAADRGHSKAQFEHALGLFAEGKLKAAAVYLELAARAGETAAGHVRTALFEQMSPTSQERTIQLADNWRPLPAVH
ncbi:hypothetical protein DCAR_0727659 [Daucus carota subsp. sativus]|nr:hypothetical protein DCAR_0727659 [Daucus carota subsp. sativus]